MVAQDVGRRGHSIWADWGTEGQRKEARPQGPTVAAPHRIWREAGEHHGGHGEVSAPAQPSHWVKQCQLNTA